MFIIFLICSVDMNLLYDCLRTNFIVVGFETVSDSVCILYFNQRFSTLTVARLAILRLKVEGISMFQVRFDIKACFHDFTESKYFDVLK